MFLDAIYVGYSVGFVSWNQLLPFLMEGNKLVLLLTAGVLVSANLFYSRAFRARNTDSFSLTLALFQF